MTFGETLDYLFSRLPMYFRVGAVAYKPDLTNTAKICNLLGNPQDSFRSIHVAGTNGKGSVSHMLASILQEKGLKTGLYTSPHLKDFRERIRVNGKMIPKRKVVEFVKKYRKEFEKIQPSFFEWTVGLAFDHFREEKIDIGVIEVGLGGRLDSTNIITPLLSVITNISYDHMQFLGDTLEKIASEKAGIIKPGVPVVIGETQEETKHVFIDKANETGSEILFADQAFKATSCNVIASDANLQNPASCIQHPASRKLSASASLCFINLHKKGKSNFNRVESPLLGAYQLKNITTVAGTCEMLGKQGFSISEDKIRRGIKNVILNTHLAGRWQMVSHNPLTICDTGHNEAGIREVLAQFKATPHSHLHFVFGVVNDKQIDHILDLLPKDATYYFCKADIPRGLPQEELKNKSNAAGLKGESYPSVKKALKAAQKKAKPDDLVFVGGSTFVVAEVV
jgi:dihydrofolate synthase / folylpolyglutamate synthase